MSELKNKTFEIESVSYKFIKHIADGGSSSVWEVENEKDNKKYAIKILNKEKENKKERFENEIKFCKNNKHNNLVPIYSYGKINNSLCFVMPLYEYNLSSIMEKDISIEIRFDYILQICRALKFLHDKNVVHRDLKPENILIKNNTLVLADLGIAHFENSSMTKNNDLLANRKYAAPEQKIKGLSNNITTAVDIYSLGLIINEIFTNKKPEGSNFTLISDVYPWLINIDEIVERCMRQNPLERPSITEVLLDLNLKFSELKDEINSIKENLQEDLEIYNSHIKRDGKIINNIIDQAPYDILTAKYFFDSKTYHELKKYNFNYNCNIHYKLDKYLKMDYMKHLIKNRCKKSFLYESHVYEYGKKYKPLDLYNTQDKKLYEKFSAFLRRNCIVDGEILKLFSSCCDYHCEEIIKDLEKIQDEVEVLNDAPILYIVTSIISIKESLYDISLDDYILVNWDKTISNYDNKIADMGVFYEESDQNKMKEVLSKFIEKYNAVATKKGSDFVIRFEKYEIYNDFKNYALKLSEPYYIFNGDVLDLIKIEKEYEGIVELKAWDSFDILNVLAKIIGLREDY